MLPRILGQKSLTHYLVDAAFAGSFCQGIVAWTTRQRRLHRLLMILFAEKHDALRQSIFEFFLRMRVFACT